MLVQLEQVQLRNLKETGDFSQHIKICKLSLYFSLLKVAMYQCLETALILAQCTFTATNIFYCVTLNQ